MNITHNLAAKIQKLKRKIAVRPAVPGGNGKPYIVNEETIKDSRFFNISGAHVFFGYYDLQELSADGNKLLAHTVGRKANPAADVADIGYFDISDGEFHKLASTRAWCWQQGSRLRWHPQDSDVLLYNDIHKDGYVTRAVSLSGEAVSVPEIPAVYDISSDCKYGVSVNFARLQRLRPGYGYSVLQDLTAEVSAPDDDGIFLTDMQTGKSELIISLHELARESDKERRFEHYINHVSFCPKENKFLFFHVAKRIKNDPGVFSRQIELYVYDIDTASLKLVESEWITSHYAWRNKNEILATSAKGDTTLYCIYDLAAGMRRVLEHDGLKEDGHPSFLNLKNFFVCDTSPDIKNCQKLGLYDIEHNEMRHLATFYHMPVRSKDMRCDLHPRVWDRDGKQIVTLDTTCRGVREVFVGMLSRDTKTEGISEQ